MLLWMTVQWLLTEAVNDAVDVFLSAFYGYSRTAHLCSRNSCTAGAPPGGPQMSGAGAGLAGHMHGRGRLCYFLITYNRSAVVVVLLQFPCNPAGLG
jgi:hypothetical protein